MANFIKHTNCEHCGSSDANALYDDGSSHCFSCRKTIGSDGYKSEAKESVVRKYVRKDEQVQTTKVSKPVITEEQKNEIKEQTTTKCYGYRGLSDSITQYFRVRHSIDDRDDVISQYYPVTQEGQLTGYKVRDNPKDFRSIGRTGAECELFGQFLFNRGGKYLIITEGEIDALSAYQMMKAYSDARGGNYETAVVSPTTGANSSRQLANNYRFFDSFENIILCYDNDKVGKEAAIEAVKVLPKGKVKMMNLKYKDANEYLENNAGDQFVRDFYNAETYTPVGVLGSGQLYEKILQQAQIARVAFPPFMNQLNDMLVGGIPLGHIINIAAGTGIGKCLGQDTPVVMYDRSVKKVQDIVEGELVLGPDGTPRKVTGVISGIDELYRVSQVNGDSYVVNSEHILSLKKTGNYDVVNIPVKDYVKLSNKQKHLLKGYKANIYSSCVSSESDDTFYMLGLWLADGTRGQPCYTVADKDVEIIEKIHQYAHDNNYEVTYREQTSACKGYYLKGGFYKEISKFVNIDTKEIHQDTMSTMTYDQRLSLLAGFVDGDGYLTYNCYNFTVSDNKLCEQLVFLLREVGLRVNVSSVFKKCQGYVGGMYNSVTASGDIDKIPTILPRRKAQTRKQKKNPLVCGITVEPIGVGQYFGFELIGKDKLFCLGDFTVTHNTSLVNEMIYHWVFHSPHKIGIVSMELDAGQYGETLLSRHIQKKIALIKDDAVKQRMLTSDEVKNKAHELFFDGEEHRFYLLDNRDGSIEEIQDTIEELVISCGCKIVVLDPLQDILDGLTIDEQALFMKWSKGIIKSHGVSLIFINHVRKSASGTASSSNGGKYSEEEIQGSSTIIKSASANILLSRDKTNDDPIIRNTTKIMLSKNRICGITGPAGEIYYDNETHTLHNKAEFLPDHH